MNWNGGTIEKRLNLDSTFLWQDHNVVDDTKKYFTQNELAERWCVKSGTITNWRQKGRISYFQPKGSSRKFYPVDFVLEYEQNNTTRAKEVTIRKKQQAELQGKKPVMSTKPRKEWRI